MCMGPELFVALGASAGTASTLATVGSVAMAGMTGLSALGSMEQGKQMQQMGEYNAQVAQNQAIAARQKADFDLKQQKRQAAQFKGTQRANMSATGGELLDMGDVKDMSATDLELEALGIKYGATMDQTAAQQRATLARMEGAAGKQKAYSEAGSTLLTGAKSGLALL